MWRLIQSFKNAATVLTKSEIGKCRSALGALQWLAVQTQPQICARCNLLLSELAREPKMTVAQEIQQVIRETRKHLPVSVLIESPL